MSSLYYCDYMYKSQGVDYSDFYIVKLNKANYLTYRLTGKSIDVPISLYKDGLTTSKCFKLIDKLEKQGDVIIKGYLDTEDYNSLIIEISKKRLFTTDHYNNLIKEASLLLNNIK